MGGGMAIRIATLSSLLAGALALLVLVAASPAASAAGGERLQAMGRLRSEELRNGEARKAVLCLVNKQRDQAGLKPLDRDKKLQRAAQRHNEKMDGSGCFDHECGGEADLGSRLENVGYLAGGITQWAVGREHRLGLEARGTPKAIVDAWMHSAGHRANILSTTFDEIGVGFSAGTPELRRPAPAASTRPTSACGQGLSAPSHRRRGYNRPRAGVV